MTEPERILRKSEAAGWPADDPDLAALKARNAEAARAPMNGFEAAQIEAERRYLNGEPEPEPPAPATLQAAIDELMEDISTGLLAVGFKREQ